MPKTGRSSGNVTDQKARQGPAPSTRAASCSSLGTLLRPASTLTEMNGNECHTMTSVRIEKNSSGSLNQPYPVQSARPNTEFDRPSGSALNSQVTRPLVSSKIHFQTIAPVSAGVAQANITQLPTNVDILGRSRFISSPTSVPRIIVSTTLASAKTTVLRSTVRKNGSPMI